MAGFTPVTFGGENVTPKNDGGLYQAHFGDGILWGCGMSLTGTPYTDLTISAGEMIIGGRVIYVDGATDIDLTAIANTTNFVQVKGVITLGNNPVFDTALVESATATFPGLTQEDINDNGTTYEVELAVVSASAGTPTAIYSTMGASSIVTEGTFAMTRNGDVVGRLYSNASGNLWNVAKVSNGSSVVGIYGDSTDAGIFYSQNGLYLRPNGLNDSTGQVVVGTNGNATMSGDLTLSGQVHGGHQIISDSKTTSTSITAGTWSQICQVTLPVGTFILQGTANIKGLGASVTNWAMVNIGHTNAANVARNSIPLFGTTSSYLGANVSYIFENTSANYTMSLYVNAEANTSVSSGYLNAIQIG